MGGYLSIYIGYIFVGVKVVGKRVKGSILFWESMCRNGKNIYVEYISEGHVDFKRTISIISPRIDPG